MGDECITYLFTAFDKKNVKCNNCYNLYNTAVNKIPEKHDKELIKIVDIISHYSYQIKYRTT